MLAAAADVGGGRGPLELLVVVHSGNRWYYYNYYFY
jgi:hypothetical protein